MARFRLPFTAVVLFLSCNLVNNRVFGQGVVVSGIVVDEKDQALPDVEVNVVRAGQSIITRKTGQGGQYTLPIGGGTPIDSISFFREDRHPGFVLNVCGNRNGQQALAQMVVNKTLFPRVGPRGFERNLDQLLTYERIMYTLVARGIPRGVVINKFQKLLGGMPDPANFAAPQLVNLTPVQRSLLLRKRAEVFALYGLLVAVPAPVPALAPPPP